MPPGGLPTLPKASEIQDILFSNTFSKCCIFRQTRKCLNSKQQSKQTRKASHDETARVKKHDDDRLLSWSALLSKKHSQHFRPTVESNKNNIHHEKASGEGLTSVAACSSSNFALHRSGLGSSASCWLFEGSRRRSHQLCRSASCCLSAATRQSGSTSRLQTHDDADESQTN